VLDKAAANVDLELKS